MRLLNTTILELESFADNAIPPHAILSHVWGPANDAVSIEDMQAGSAAKEKPGYIKLRRSSLIAAHDGFKHIWIDTCCIQKSSSIELSEAINSMFCYYQNSDICYAFWRPSVQLTCKGNLPTASGLREDGHYKNSLPRSLYSFSLVLGEDRHES